MTVKAFSGNSKRTPDGVRFRNITDDDLEFLGKLYASTRKEEVDQVTHWTEEQKAEFLDQQFKAQHEFYTQQFTDAEFLIIEQNEQAVGRVYIDRREKEIRLIDIALLPETRGQGFGTALLKEILDEGRSSNLPVSIHVEKNNPAMRLYKRLGFKDIEDQGVYDLMEWQPLD